MGLDEWVERLFGRFSREKKQEIDVPTAWIEEHMPDEFREGIDSKTMPVLKLEYVDKKYRVPGLLLFKRVTAFLLFFVNMGFTVAGVMSPASMVKNIMTLFFAFSAFIMADYLWKTRGMRKEWGEVGESG